MLQPSDEWAVSRHDFSLESLAKVTAIRPRRLAAMAD
jgi:hypothetical protein